jgi:hypothetical protein
MEAALEQNKDDQLFCAALAAESDDYLAAEMLEWDVVVSDGLASW